VLQYFFAICIYKRQQREEEKQNIFVYEFILCVSKILYCEQNGVTASKAFAGANQKKSNLPLEPP
jgi:hypothetical protein